MRRQLIKRTLYFGNPAYLSTHLDELEIKILDTGETKKVHVEDTWCAYTGSRLPYKQFGMMEIFRERDYPA